MNDTELESVLRRGLHDVAEELVPDMAAPPLAPGERSVGEQAPRFRLHRGVAVAAAVVLVGVAAVWVSTRGDDSRRVDVTDSGPAETVTTVPQPADAPPGAVLLATAEQSPDLRFELWSAATADGTVCQLTTSIEDGTRWLEGSSCPGLPRCLSVEWGRFVPMPDPKDEGIQPDGCFGAVTVPTVPRPGTPGGPVLGGVRTRANSSAPDEAVLVEAEVAPEVAAWAVTLHDGTVLEQPEPVRDPRDAATLHLFAVVPDGTDGFTMTLYGPDGTVLHTADMYCPAGVSC